MRIGEHVEAKWTDGRGGGDPRKLEIWDRVSGQRIEIDSRAARMLAALIHVEFKEVKTNKVR